MGFHGQKRKHPLSCVSDIQSRSLLVYRNDISFSISHEGCLRLRATNTDVAVGAKAAADSLALVPLPQVLWERILYKCREKDVLDRALWNADVATSRRYHVLLENLSATPPTRTGIS